MEGLSQYPEIEGQVWDVLTYRIGPKATCHGNGMTHVMCLASKCCQQLVPALTTVGALLPWLLLSLPTFSASHSHTDF